MGNPTNPLRRTTRIRCIFQVQKLENTNAFGWNVSNSIRLLLFQSAYAILLYNVTDYEMLGQADSDQAQAIVDKANRFVDRRQTYLAIEGYL